MRDRRIDLMRESGRLGRVMPTVLSIQSHVAFGHVGNRAAVFPLERLGCEVVAINTVQFSNHTGYGAWTGQVFPPEHVADVVGGLAARGVLGQCDALLTGYLGDPALGRVILETLEAIRRERPGARWCCDPVMGDIGRGFFVKPGLPEFFRDHAVPAADVLTPNRFELEYLSGRPVGDIASALAATAALRSKGTGLVLVTSLDRSDGDPATIEMLLDSAEGAWLVGTPRLALDPAPNGAGDATAALFLAKLLETGDPVTALGHAAAAIWAVFDRTAKAGTRELALIAAQDELVRPTRQFRPLRVR